MNPLDLPCLRKGCHVIALIAVLSASALAQTNTRPRPSEQTVSELRTARAFEAARANPSYLGAFLIRMPKGGDLHNHLSGAVYAESWIRAGVEDQLCVNLASLSFAKPQSVASSEPRRVGCEDGSVAAIQAYGDQHLYDALVDAFSMRGFVPSPGVTGHDHFFDAFAHFGGTHPSHLGEWLDEVATRAAAQNEQYL